MATNKLQSSFASMAATIHFPRNKFINIQANKWMASAGFVASVSGSYWVQLIGNQFLLTFMPIGLIAIALYFFNKELGKK